jgi:hypothetical protein
MNPSSTHLTATGRWSAGARSVAGRGWQVIEAVPACADPAPVAAGAWYPSLALPVAPFGTTRGFTTEPTSNGTIHPMVNKRPTRLLGTTPT